MEIATVRYQRTARDRLETIEDAKRESHSGISSLHSFASTGFNATDFTQAMDAALQSSIAT